MSLLLRIADRTINRPLLIHPDKLPLITGVLEGRIPLGDMSVLKEAACANIEQLPDGAQATMFGPNPTASRFVGSSTDEDPVTGRRTALPYRRTREGVAIIPVIGSLINRGAWLGSSSGETSYEGLKFQIAHAADDPRATAILLDIDSPGGEAVGCFEVSAAIRQASTKKPITAVVNGMAASAAYAIASAAQRIVVTETGVTGSIGVVLLHGDFSRKLDKEGVTLTLIFAGAHKVDGNPFEALPDSVRESLQKEVLQFYGLFVRTVAAGRGARMSERMIRATEAQTYIGSAAVDEGLADEVGTFETALDDAGKAHVGFSKVKRRMTMATEKTAPDANSGLTNAQVEDKVAAARAEGHSAGKAEGIAIGKIEGATEAKAANDAAVATAKADATKAANERVKAIVGLEEAKGRDAAALSLALNTSMSANEAKAVLAGLPKATAGDGTRSSESPLGITLGGDKKQGPAADVLSPEEVAANINKQFGAKK